MKVASRFAVIAGVLAVVISSSALAAAARPCQEVCKRAQAAAFSSAVGWLGFTRTPLTYVTPSATSARSSGASSRRNVRSAISSVFQMTAVAFSTFLYRFAALVRKRTAANGDSTGFVSGMKEEPSPRCHGRETRSVKRAIRGIPRYGLEGKTRSWRQCAMRHAG